MKSTPHSFAALSRVLAYLIGSPPETPASMEIGVTEILLFTIGISYFFSMLSPVDTSFSAFRQILSYIFLHDLSMSLSAASSREIPMVIVLISRDSSCIIPMVSKMSFVFNIYTSSGLNPVHCVKDIFVHNVNCHAFGFICNIFLKFIDRNCELCDIDDHNHTEDFVQN